MTVPDFHNVFVVSSLSHLHSITGQTVICKPSRLVIFHAISGVAEGRRARDGGRVNGFLMPPELSGQPLHRWLMLPWLRWHPPQRPPARQLTAPRSCESMYPL